MIRILYKPWLTGGTWIVSSNLQDQPSAATCPGLMMVSEHKGNTIIAYIWRVVYPGKEHMVSWHIWAKEER